ncbi:hypothetical protein LF1_31840 [Rubripirellula obstinata]|uniref:Uncharacterized protein n=1 Tax=Rubripirellula obstinata TaxID=406547 RepID=A0A5B1CN01_9BACT|nr:hypothetical protein LF1_31840 [Rubripirellula obstinata]
MLVRLAAWASPRASTWNQTRGAKSSMAAPRRGLTPRTVGPHGARGDAWADENAVGDVIREPVEHCKLKILGKRYSLVNLHFSVFILQFAINTEAGQPQTPKVVQFPSTQTFSSAQAMPTRLNDSETLHGVGANRSIEADCPDCTTILGFGEKLRRRDFPPFLLRA